MKKQCGILEPTVLTHKKSLVHAETHNRDGAQRTDKRVTMTNEMKFLNDKDHPKPMWFPYL